LDVPIALVALTEPAPEPPLAIPDVAETLDPPSPPLENRQDLIDDALAAPAAVLPPESEPAPALLPETPTTPAIQPLTSAIDAAARLAADASVAAEALENLKRL